MIISSSILIIIIISSLLIFGVFLCIKLFFLHKKLFSIPRSIEASEPSHHSYIIHLETTAFDLKTFKEGKVEIKEYTEAPMVSKGAFVTGEVSLEKEIDEADRTVEGAVRKTEIDTENFTETTNKLNIGSKLFRNEDTDSGFYK